LITKHELMGNLPEKVLGVSRDWAARHPATHQALITALLEACVWLDAAPAHRAEAAELLCGGYVDAPIEVIARSLTGWLKRGPAEAAEPHPDFHVFHRYAAGFPWRSYADWTIVQMLRWGQISTPLDIRAVADAVYRPELYRVAAHALGLPFPTIDRKREGDHDAPWQLTEASRPIAMGRGNWADGSRFDPADPVGHLAALPIARLHAELPALAALNPPESR
jgi:nitrate/nitrite transport system substrate-binding protein